VGFLGAGVISKESAQIHGLNTAATIWCSVNRAPMEPKSGSGSEPEILVNHLMEGIGLALDLNRSRMFITDLAGSVYSANLDGSNKKTLLVGEGNLTGTHMESCRLGVKQKPRASPRSAIRCR
jgi:hypothetical protein